MCGRTTSTISRDEVAELLDVDEVATPELPPRWNVAPAQQVYAVVPTRYGQRRLGALSWGLVHKRAGRTVAGRLINARAETLAVRPAFRSLVESHRALLIFSGFYEWQRAGAGRGRSQPYYFYRGDGAALVFAALWDMFVGPDGQRLGCCAIITTCANAVMAPVHSRMPAILGPGDWEEWTSRRPLSPGRLEGLLRPVRCDVLAAHPVGPAVNSVLNDGPGLVLPVAEHQGLVVPRLELAETATEGIIAGIPAPGTAG
ncbi:MAG TPA: SOS response-associated peptidase [Acidimicrobiales bacterium]|nr:SOS response-associated peptidase [Acidimicrobiales bacterium]